MGCNCGNKNLPPLKTAVKNAAKSVAKSAKQFFTGGKVFADKATIKSRMGICLKCPELVKANGEKRCTICGCFIEAKIGLHVETCPKGEW